MSRAASIVVTRRLPQAVLDLVAARPATALHCWPSETEPMPRAELLEYVRRDGGAAAIVCMLSDKIDAEVLDAAGPSLKVISTMSVGYSHIDVAACRSRGVRLGYTPDVLTDATADLVLALTLATARRLPEALTAAKDGSWAAWAPFWLCGKDLHHARVGIVGGAGRIGSAIARRLLGFECEIAYTGRSGPKPEFEASLGGRAAVWRPLEALLAESDFVILICALTPETRGLLDGARLRLMKPDAVLINASRGEVVEQEDLVQVLRERPGFRAGLDVTTPEPLPLDSPLLSLPNAVVLPHIGSASTATRTLMARMAVENALGALPPSSPGGAGADSGKGAGMPAEVLPTA
jgi:glyoxylate/hydroxypyruvate reductase